MSLPSGYKRLEYIKSSGTQYINTEFKPNQNTRIVCNIELLSSDVMTAIFGARISYKNTAFVLWGGGDSARTHFQDDYANETDATISCHAGKYNIDKNKNITSINSSTHTFNSANFQSAYPLYICAINTAGTAGFGTGSIRIYSFQIYDNGNLIRDFVPCIKDDGYVGLYDLVGKQFYGNAGKGTFTAGPVIAIAADKSEITKLKYIQSSGTQWIDTGFKPTGATKVVIDFQMVSQGSAQQGVFGSRPGASGRFTVFTGDSTGALQVDYGTYGTLATETNTISGLNLNNRNTIEVNNSLIINGNTVKTVSVVSFVSTYNLFLFANNNVGTAQLPCSMKLYSCKIYDNGTLVHDFIPCQKHDGTIGLYDKLNSLLYVNAGTGVFTAGPSSLNLPVNIGGTWKDANEVFVNIGGTWKAVEAAFVIIGGTWKELG